MMQGFGTHSYILGEYILSGELCFDPNFCSTVTSLKWLQNTNLMILWTNRQMTQQVKMHQTPACLAGVSGAAVEALGKIYRLQRFKSTADKNWKASNFQSALKVLGFQREVMWMPLGLWHFTRFYMNIWCLTQKLTASFWRNYRQPRLHPLLQKIGHQPASVFPLWPQDSLMFQQPMT